MKEKAQTEEMKFGNHGIKTLHAEEITNTKS